MELALVIREIWSRKRIVAIGLIIAPLLALMSVAQVNGTSIKPKGLQFSEATTQLFIDTPKTALGNVGQDVTQLQTRATVLANFMASPTIVDLIGKQVGLSGDQLYAAGPVNVNQARAVIEPTELKRNVQVTGETIPYRLEFLNDPTLPTITVNTQAPTTTMAVALANASAQALERYVMGLETVGSTPHGERVVVRQLGVPNGGVVDAGISKKLFLVVFVLVFALWCAVVLVAGRFRANWKASRGVYDQLTATAIAEQEATASSNGNGHVSPEPAHDTGESSTSERRLVRPVRKQQKPQRELQSDSDPFDTEDALMPDDHLLDVASLARHSGRDWT